MRLDGQYMTCTYTDPAELWNVLKHMKWQQVIVENFSTAGRISQYGLHTVRQVGAVQALCWAFNMPLIIHEPQFRKAYLEPAHKYLRSLRAPYVEHEADALSHLLAWERTGR